MGQARAAFVASCGEPSGRWKLLDGTAIVTGVGFVDKIHGQTGVAPNGIELHPVTRVSRISCTKSEDGARNIIPVGLNQAVHGALARVQLRRGVRYQAVARGRVSGRRVPVALSFRSAGRYLLRVCFQEAGKGTVTKVVAITVR